MHMAQMGINLEKSSFFEEKFMVTKQNETVEFSKMWFIISKVQMTSLIIFELKQCIFERKSKIANEK